MWWTIRQLSSFWCHIKSWILLSSCTNQQTQLSLWKVCALPEQGERIPAGLTQWAVLPLPPTALTTLHTLSLCTLIAFGLITSHFPTINCLSHLPACNPDKSKSFGMSLLCSSAPPTSPALFYVISIFQALLKLHPARGHCTHFNSNPPAHQCFNSLLIYLYCLLSEPNSINKSWNSNTCTRLNYAYKHSSGDRRQLLWSRSFL